MVLRIRRSVAVSAISVSLVMQLSTTFAFGTESGATVQTTATTSSASSTAATSPAPTTLPASKSSTTPTIPASSAASADSTTSTNSNTSTNSTTSSTPTGSTMSGQVSETVNQATQATKTDAAGGAPKFLIKPGQPISVSMEQEDLVPTDDVQLATQQSLAYPESPEAAFILAVALTRTSRIEEALREVRRARRLAEKVGGPAYFDQMISQYEKMLEYTPDENRVRYGLAWAYYMKAYLLTSAKPAPKPPVAGVTPFAPAAVATTTAAASATSGTSKATTTVSVPGNPALKIPTTGTTTLSTKKNGNDVSITINNKNAANWADAAKANMLLAALNPKLATSVPSVPGSVPTKSLPEFKGALANAAPEAVPQVKKYYEAALKNLDDLLVRNPKDVWARVYRAFLYTEYTGDLNSSMEVWKSCKAEYPNNPAPYFFLGQGYLKQGNLKESLNYISRAVALRATGN